MRMGGVLCYSTRTPTPSRLESWKFSRSAAGSVSSAVGDEDDVHAVVVVTRAFRPGTRARRGARSIYALRLRQILRGIVCARLRHRVRFLLLRIGVPDQHHRSLRVVLEAYG